MKNNFVIVILLFLAITGLGFSAPQKRADITPDEIAKVAKLAQSQDPIALLGELSPQCQSALLTIVADPRFLQCVPIPAFLPLLPFFADPAEIASLISDPKTGLKTLQPALIQFSDGLCAAPKCSDQFIANAIKTIQTGCGPNDMKNPVIQIIFPAVVFYSPGRDTICFKDTGNPSHFCLVEDDITTLINLPNSTLSIIGNEFIDSIVFAEPTAICTTCNKAIYNTFVNFISSNAMAKQIIAGFQSSLKEVAIWLGVKCGFEFEDGKVSNPSQPPINN